MYLEKAMTSDNTVFTHRGLSPLDPPEGFSRKRIQADTPASLSGCATRTRSSR